MAKLQVKKRVKKVRDGVKSFGKRHIRRLPMPPYHHALLSLSLLSALFALVCFTLSPRLALIFLLLMIALDFLDYSITEKYFLHSNSRRIRDQMADRLSEGILFVNFFNPWFFLFSINCVLTIIGYVKKRNIALPLKVFFVIYFIIFYII